MFLVYKLQTSKNCKKVKHTMIMILGIIYIFLLYVIFHQQLKITFRKSSATPPSLKKIHSPIFTHSFPKNLKSASPPPFCQHWNFSTPSPLQKGGGQCNSEINNRQHYCFLPLPIYSFPDCANKFQVTLYLKVFLKRWKILWCHIILKKLPWWLGNGNISLFCF